MLRRPATISLSNNILVIKLTRAQVFPHIQGNSLLLAELLLAAMISTVSTAQSLSVLFEYEIAGKYVDVSFSDRLVSSYERPMFVVKKLVPMARFWG